MGSVSVGVRIWLGFLFTVFPITTRSINGAECRCTDADHHTIHFKLSTALILLAIKWLCKHLRTIVRKVAF